MRPKSRAGTCRFFQPRRHRSATNNTKNEKLVRLWERISGSMGRRACPDGSNLPVNAARPNVAEIPHKNVATAM